MAISDIQTSFAAGELSPQLYARVDLDKFQVGAALLRNFFVDYRGGASNRAGTKYIAAVAEGSRLIPFIVSTSASYVLVMSALSIAIYNRGVFVATVVTPYLAADLFEIAYTQSADVLTLVHPNYPPANLSRTTTTTFVYTVLTTGPITNPPVVTTMVAPHSGPYSFGYLVTAVDLDGKEESLPSNPAVKHSEGQNELTNRVVGMSWTAPVDAVTGDPQPVARFNVYKWGPIDAVTLNPATVWGFIGSSQTTTFTDNNIAPDFTKQPPGWGDPFSGGQFQSITVNAGGSGYDGVSGDWPVIPYVPLVITGDGTGAAGYAVIDHATGTIIGAYLTNPGKNYTAATVTAVGEGGTGATFNFTFTDPAALNPAATAYLQQRRVFGGATLKPETIVMSQTGLYNNFNTTPVALADDAIVMSIAGEQVNTIKALVPVSYGLLAFTTGGSFLINGGTPGAAISPSTISSQAQASEGANSLRPLAINYDVIYGQAKGNRIRNLAFAWQRQSYTGGDISALAAHLFDSFHTVDWTWAEEPFKIVWAVRDDGKLLSLTYVPDQEVQAWARHDTQGFFKSVCSVPEDDVNAVYVIVRRFIPSIGGTGTCEGYVDYLERMDDRTSAKCVEHSWFLDCALELPRTPGDGHLWFSGYEGDVVMKLCAPTLLGVHFDGECAIENAALVATDSTALSFAYWFRYEFGPYPGVYIVWWRDPLGSSPETRAKVTNNGGATSRLRVALNEATTSMELFGDEANYNSAWHHVLFSGVTDAAGQAKLYIDGVDRTTLVNHSGPGAAILWNGLPLRLGTELTDSPYPGDGFVGDLAQFWFAPGQSLLVAGDIPPETVAKFYNAGPVDLGSDGSTPTGVAPAVYLTSTSAPADFLTNHGTGGNFTEVWTKPLVASKTNPPTSGPAPSPMPVITGTPAVGDTATVALSSAWPLAIISTTYAWYDGARNPIAGQVASTFVLDAPTAGRSVFAVMTITDAEGVWPLPSNWNGDYFGPVV